MTKSTIAAVAFLAVIASAAAAVRIFECPDVGLFPDPDDCASYYMCSYGLGGFESEHFRCSEGYLYDALLLVIILLNFSFSSLTKSRVKLDRLST
jgi:hypothetical protein